MSHETPQRTAVSCIIERPNAEVLICRSANASAGERAWEFPTGLKASEESPEAAIRRVCKKRVGLAISIHTGQPPFVADYEGKLATYRFFLAVADAGKTDVTDYAEVRWVKKGQLCEYDFDKAVAPVVAWFTE